MTNLSPSQSCNWKSPAVVFNAKFGNSSPSFNDIFFVFDKKPFISRRNQRRIKEKKNESLMCALTETVETSERFL